MKNYNEVCNVNINGTKVMVGITSKDLVLNTMNGDTLTFELKRPIIRIDGWIEDGNLELIKGEEITFKSEDIMCMVSI